jgi:ABC-type antimicrobial peptide transport system permease subunit
VKRLAPSIIGLVIAFGLSVFIALVSSGGVAGVVFASNPEAIFKLAAPLACPNGTLDYQQYHASYNPPGQYQFNVDCVAADGTRKDISLQAIVYVLALIFLACFVLLGIPLGLIGFIAPLLLARLKKKNNPPSTIEPA